MTKEELQKIEYESFQKDFEELIDKHRYAFETLGMGIHIDYTAVDMIYKGGSHCVHTNGGVGFLETQKWYD